MEEGSVGTEDRVDLNPLPDPRGGAVHVVSKPWDPRQGRLHSEPIPCIGTGFVYGLMVGGDCNRTGTPIGMGTDCKDEQSLGK